MPRNDWFEIEKKKRPGPKKTIAEKSPEERSLYRKKIRKPRTLYARPTIHFADIVKHFITDRSFSAAQFRTVNRPGYFKCPLCGNKSQQFVNVVRDDGKGFSVGWSCLKLMDLHLHKSDMVWLRERGEANICFNEDEFQDMVKETERVYKLDANKLMLKRSKRKLTDKDLLDLLDGL